MSRTRQLLAASTAVLMLAGCSGRAQEVPDRPIDVAEQVLGDFISDRTKVGGFQISAAAVTVISGSPMKREQLYPVPDGSRRPVPDSADPLWVLGADFPLEESVERSRKLIDSCKGSSMVTVNPLLSGVVTTRALCDDDYTTLLDDEALPKIVDPISREAVEVLWAEFNAAGIDRQVRSVQIDRANDYAQIQFGGPDRGVTYQWSRGLRELNSMVVSLEARTDFEMDLHTISADLVGAELTRLLTKVADPAQVQLIMLEPVADGARLVLKAGDYTELAAAVITP